MAGSIARSFNGSRCVLTLDGRTVGIAQSVGVSIGFQVDPIFVIGKYETAELVPNSQQPVNITMRMVRIIGVSPLEKLRVPTLDDLSGNGLLLNTDFSVLLTDRQNNQNPVPGQGVAITQIQNCRTTGFTFDTTASQTSELTLTMTGIYLGDEGLDVSKNKDADTNPFDVI
jgi:hypothetical protein